MKLKALLAAAAAGAVCVSAASAAPPPGKGKHHGRGDDPAQTDPAGNHGRGKGDERPGKGAQPTTTCKGKWVVLGGLYVSGSADATGAGSFAMLVKHTTGNAKRLGLHGKQVTVTTDASTKVRRQGKATLSDLVANDRLVVLARACRAAATTDPSADPAAPTLLARGVVARPAKASGTGGDTGTTTTDTTPTDTVPKTGTGPSLG